MAGGGSGIDLVSLTWGTPSWPTGKGALLELYPYFPLDRGIRIEGMGIPPGFYYRLIADMGKSHFRLPLSKFSIK